MSDGDRARVERFERVTRAFEWPVGLLALAIVPALIVEETSRSPLLLRAAVLVNWTVWLVFCAEYLARLAFAPRRGAFVRQAWFDLLIILVSPPFLVPDAMESARGLRALRLLRLLRAAGVAAIGLRHLRAAMARRRFHWVALVAAITIVGGALAEYYVERRAGVMTTFGDSLWWAIVTATTVGYGDLSPVTPEGRVIAVVLMFVGIGVIGVFTATIASWFVEQELDEPPDADIRRRLEVIEEKLDRLLQRKDSR